jgi:integrase
MRRESKSTTGSVVKDRRSQIWQFFWWADGRRHSKTLGRFPTKTAAWNAAQQFRVQPPQPKHSSVPTVAALVEQYRVEKMPKRKDTKRGYQSWIRVHILPKWERNLITDLQARPVEMWLDSLPLAPKSRTHVRGHSQFSVELRNVETSHTDTGQPYQFGDGHRRVQADTPTA